MEAGRKAMVCRSCNTLRPVRSKHCPVCEVCVGRFDHHCVWTNNCVGFRNIAVFYGFLACLALDLCLTCWTCAANLYVADTSVALVAADPGAEGFSAHQLGAGLGAGGVGKGAGLLIPQEEAGEDPLDDGPSRVLSLSLSLSLAPSLPPSLRGCICIANSHMY